MLKTTLFITLALVLTKATDFTFLNKCSNDLTINSITETGTSPILDGGLVVPAGQTASGSATDWAGRIYTKKPGVSIAEFSLDQSGIDFYNIILSNGFNQATQITPSNGCTQISCPSALCYKASTNPTDASTHSCPTGASYQITYCPYGPI